MTEDENSIQDPAYLQGRVEALEDMVTAIVRLLPERATWSVQHSLRLHSEIKAVQRDANPAHQSWDMHQRSHHPLNTPPAVTLAASGYLDAMEKLMALTAEQIEALRAGYGIPQIAPSIEAIQAKADSQEFTDD